MNAAVANSLASGFSAPFFSHIAAIDVDVWKCFQADEISLRVDGALHMVIRRGAIEIVLHVVFAGPEHHDGLVADRFGDLRGLHDEVALIAAAKSAAHQRGVDDDFFFRQL